MYLQPRVVLALVITGLISTPLLAARGAAAPQVLAAKVAKAETPAPDVQAFVKQYCLSCHNERNKAAVRDFALDTVDVSKAGQHGEVWEKVVMKLRARQMPPLTARRPDRALSNQVAAWLETELDRNAAARPNPGRTESLHRLNRTDLSSDHARRPCAAGCSSGRHPIDGVSVSCPFQNSPNRYGAAEPKTGALGSVVRGDELPGFNHPGRPES